MRNKRIGFGITGSHCNLDKIVQPLKRLAEHGNTLFPILSPSILTSDTRFGTAREWVQKIEDICGRKAIADIVGAEPIGPELNLDAVVVAPCTGNTLAKLAHAITDTAVTMAVKAQLRNERPVVLAVATNDGLAGNAVNIGLLLSRKHVYFVPFGQDNPWEKPRSLISAMALIPETIEAALRGEQIQPILLR